MLLTQRDKKHRWVIKTFSLRHGLPLKSTHEGTLLGPSGLTTSPLRSAAQSIQSIFARFCWPRLPVQHVAMALRYTGVALAKWRL
jgi:hypothetical protein